MMTPKQYTSLNYNPHWMIFFDFLFENRSKIPVKKQDNNRNEMLKDFNYPKNIYFDFILNYMKHGTI